VKRRVFVNAAGAAAGRPGVIHGLHAIRAWLDCQPARLRIVRHEREPAPRTAATVEVARALGVRLEATEGRALVGMAGTTRHQGLVAEVAPFPYAALAAVVGLGARWLVVVDHIQDPHNLGAILRTAEAVGAGGLILPKDGTVGVTAAVEASAAGAAARLPVVRVANVARALEELKAAGYWAVGLVPRDGVDLYATELPDRVAVVVGGEEGLRPLVARTCDFRVGIPMAGRAESLNASVAAAILLYELHRRSRTP